MSRPVSSAASFLRLPRLAASMTLWSLVAGLLGCAPPERDYRAVVGGEVEVADADRAAVSALLEAAGTEAGSVRLLGEGEVLPESVPAVRIESGRVTGLTLLDVTDVSAAARLGAVRELRLAGPFPSLDLDGPASLRDLDLRSTGGELRRLRLAGTASLDRLSVDGARLDDPPDLSHLPQLGNLGLERCGLASVPPLGASDLRELRLAGNRIGDLTGLAGLDNLRRLDLSDNGLESLDTLPPLPRLLRLDLSNNPLGGNLAVPGGLLPDLRALDLRGTGLVAAPPGLGGDGLRVELDPGVAERSEFEATLARLREQRAAAGGELVTTVADRRGRIRGSSGDCRWRTGTSSPAQVHCSLHYDAVTGTAAARLGETDPAMPFRGGGAPRVKVTLTVGEGEAAVYVGEEFDLVEDARTIGRIGGDEVDEAWMQAARRDGDRFAGYRRVVARPGAPATVSGDVVLLGSRVLLWLEAVGGEARDVHLVVEPA